MLLTLIRHSKTTQVPEINSTLWSLNEEGIELAKELSKSNLISSIDVLYSSLQTKALETSLYLAKPNFIPIKTNDKLTEVTSITNGYIANYEETVKDYYSDKVTKINNGETKEEALARFNNAIVDLTLREADKKNIGIVAHCNILALFCAQFYNKSAYEIHNLIQMPDVAILDWGTKTFTRFYKGIYD